MIQVQDVTKAFAGKKLFENVSTTFPPGRRYGLTGPNGAGKTTFMKILSGDLEPDTGTVSRPKRFSVLKQDQYAFEDRKVLDAVLMGNTVLWEAMQEKEKLLAKPDLSDADGARLGELEGTIAEEDGYSAEAQAATLLEGLGIFEADHQRLMREITGGDKVRVLLAQALFANPDILLLDEPTNNLDINTIRWLEDVINERGSTMIIISHDRHFLNQVCTHMADLDYGKITVYPGNYDDFMEASTQARATLSAANAKAKERVAELQGFVRRFSANKSKARQATSRAKLIEKIKIEDSSRTFNTELTAALDAVK